MPWSRAPAWTSTHQFASCAYKELREVPEGLPANVTTLSLSADKITVMLRRGAFADVTQMPRCGWRTMRCAQWRRARWPC